MKLLISAFFTLLLIGFAGGSYGQEAGTLGPAVTRAITEIQGLLQPDDGEPDYEAAKIELDELRERRFERMNDFEKSILLNYYASFYLNTEDYAGAIGSFEETLEIETLREDARLRTLRQLGQLQAAEEKWEDSIKYYQQWRDLSLEEDDLVSRGLSYARSQLEQYAVETVNYASGSVYVGEFKDGNPTDKEPVILSYSN